MNKLSCFSLLLITSSQVYSSELSSAEISAKIAVMDKVSFDCIVNLRSSGLPPEGKVWVSCDRYQKRLNEYNEIIKRNPSLSGKDKKAVMHIEDRKPLIKEFSRY